MDYRTTPYTVEDENGNEIVCDAVIVNGAGEWAGIWQRDSADHVTYDGNLYISAPDNWGGTIRLDLEIDGENVTNTYGHVFFAHEYEAAISYLVKTTRMGKQREQTLRQLGSVSLNPRYHNGHSSVSLDAFGTEQGK